MADPPVLGGISEAELDAIVSQLRTDKNLAVAPVPAAHERWGAQAEQLLLSNPGLFGLGEPGPAREEAARHGWYVALGERVAGPLHLAALRGYWERGELGPDSLCWRKGFEGWTRVCHAAGLAELLAPRPDTVPSTPEELVPDPRAGVVDFPLKGAEGLRILASELPPPLPNREPAPPPPALEPEPVTAPMMEPEPATVPEAPQAGAHPVLAAPPPAQVEVRVRGGAWLALGGGLVGGMLVALAMWLLGLANAPGVSSRATSAPVPAAPAPVLASPAAPESPRVPPAAVATAPVAAPLAPASGVEQALATPAGAAPAQVPAIGVLPEPGKAADGVNSTRVPASLPRSAPMASESVQAPKSAGAPARGAPPEPALAKLAKAEVSAHAGPASGKRGASAADKETEEDGEDLGLDEAFARELDNPAKRAVPPKRTVWVPPELQRAEVPESLTQSDIFSVVVANKADIASCVSAQKLPSEEGTRKVVLRWTILPSGNVTDAVTETAGLRGTPLALCLEGKVRAWTFPKHREQGEPVRFPFTF